MALWSFQPPTHLSAQDCSWKQHAWYADDSAVAGSWTHISHHFHHLQQLGSTYGYFPEASKSVIVVSPSHQSAAQALCSILGVKVCTSHCYLGSFLGKPTKLDSRLLPKIDHWLLGIHQLAKAAKQYPQAAYAALQESLQMEWQYLQPVAKDCKSFFPLSRILGN